MKMKNKTQAEQLKELVELDLEKEFAELRKKNENTNFEDMLNLAIYRLQDKINELVEIVNLIEKNEK